MSKLKWIGVGDHVQVGEHGPIGTIMKMRVTVLQDGDGEMTPLGIRLGATMGPEEYLVRAADGQEEWVLSTHCVVQ